jgi:hypothetical protein
VNKGVVLLCAGFGGLCTTPSALRDAKQGENYGRATERPTRWFG